MKLVFSIILLISIFSLSAENIIIDSKMTLEEAIKGTKAPEKVLKDLVLLDVKYYSFDKKLHQGQIVVHKDVAEDVQSVFKIILDEKFPVNKCIPIVKYDWSDNVSMNENNTSAFNYRNIANTDRLSNHSFGKAVDINPMQNPVVYADGKISPKGAKFNTKARGTFSAESPIVKEFLRLGWRWGGNFNSFKDNHHFDKE